MFVQPHHVVKGLLSTDYFVWNNYGLFCVGNIIDLNNLAP